MASDFLNNIFKKRKYFRLSYYRNNLSYFATLLVYFMINMNLIFIQLYLYSDFNDYIKVARVCGILLDFNCMIIILLPLRCFVTWMRTLVGKDFRAIDQFIDFHKFIGYYILLLSIVHTAAHSVNLYYLSDDSDSNDEYPTARTFFNISERSSYVDLLFTDESKIGWIFYLAIPTGWVLMVIIFLIVVSSLNCIRRTKLFKAFYYAHKLYLLFYIVLIIHCANFWKWGLASLIIFIFEFIYRKVGVKISETQIKDVYLLKSDVTNLKIRRPENFQFKPGDYVYVKIPVISKHEWHPFTLSSAPEEADFLTLHIGSFGDWTRKLHSHFQEYCDNSETGTCRPRRTNMTILNNLSRVQRTNGIALNSGNKVENVNQNIFIDGPYGTASRRIFDSKNAVLIAGGIGVTPFASVLKNLWYSYKNSLMKCPNCSHEWYQINLKKIKRIDFIWINQNYDSFEWFVELLCQIEAQQLSLIASSVIKHRFINLHLFMTRAKEDKTIQLDNSSYTLKLLKGRPNLNSIFQEISHNAEGKVDVYFCGSALLGKDVQKKAIQHKFNFAKEYF